MNDFSKILSQAKELETSMREKQEKIKKIEAEGISGGNKIKITLNGEGEIKKIEMSDDLLNENKSVIEDLIIQTIPKKKYSHDWNGELLNKQMAKRLQG